MTHLFSFISQKGTTKRQISLQAIYTDAQIWLTFIAEYGKQEHSLNFLWILTYTDNLTM